MRKVHYQAPFFGIGERPPLALCGTVRQRVGSKITTSWTRDRVNCKKCLQMLRMEDHDRQEAIKNEIPSDRY